MIFNIVVQYILDDNVLNFQHHPSLLTTFITCLFLFMAVPYTKTPKVGPLRSTFPLNESKMVTIFCIVVQYILSYSVLNFQHHPSRLAKVITYRVSKYAFCSVKNIKNRRKMSL